MLADVINSQELQEFIPQFVVGSGGNKVHLTKTSLQTQNISTNFQVVTSEHRSRPRSKEKLRVLVYAVGGEQFLSVSYPNQSSTWHIHKEP